MNIKPDSDMISAFEQLFELANMSPPSDDITGIDLLLTVRELKTAIQTAQSNTPSLSAAGASQPAFGGDDNPFAAMAGAFGGPPVAAPTGQQVILIVGELGIITYQLKVALTKKGAHVTIVRGVDEAIAEYYRRNYTGVLIDVYMPTEREGLLVLSEIKKIEQEKGLRTEVVVLATPVREKQNELHDISIQKGASVFLQKTEGWHQRAINFFMFGKAEIDD